MMRRGGRRLRERWERRRGECGSSLQRWNKYISILKPDHCQAKAVFENHSLTVLNPDFSLDVFAFASLTKVLTAGRIPC